jgi:hypothetical protein
VAVKFNYMIQPELIAKIGASFGNRVYYYDNDLYTVFNQDETQLMMLSAGIDYYYSWDLLFNFSYQHNKFTKQLDSFDGYYANYFIAGVKFTW